MRARSRLALLALGLGIATFLLIWLADACLPYSEVKASILETISFPGAVAAGLVYPEGIHTGHGAPLFVPLALAANLAIYIAFWYACCWLGRFFLRRRAGYTPPR
jgi:hypothetical protein